MARPKLKGVWYYKICGYAQLVVLSMHLLLGDNLYLWLAIIPFIPLWYFWYYINKPIREYNALKNGEAI